MNNDTLKNNFFINNLILGITPVILMLSLLLKLPVYVAMAVCLVLTFTISIFRGFSIKQLFIMMKEGVFKVKPVIIMLIFIGALISTWMKIGTLSSMIYYGIQLLSNTNIILAAFISCSIMSMIIGTGIGTVSTVGIAYIGIAKGLNIPLVPVVGAVVSGAYIGDRHSPMSSNLNLILNVTGVPLNKFFKTLSRTGIPAYFISILFYWIVGNHFTPKNNDLSSITALKDTLINFSTIHWLCLLPPIIIVIEIAVLKWTVVRSIILSLLVSVIIGFYLISGEMSSIFSIIFFGYHPENISISAIMSGGGILSMLTVVAVITFSTALCGIYDGTKMLEPILEKISSKIKNKFDMFLYTGGISLLISFATCNQTLASIIPGKYLSKKCDELGMERKEFALSISDIGMITVPIIPWNVNAILVTAITQIGAVDYLPYAFFCYILPIISLIAAFFRYNKRKLKYEIQLSRNR